MDLLNELEAFWNGIEAMDKSLDEFDLELKNQDPPSGTVIPFLYPKSSVYKLITSDELLM